MAWYSIFKKNTSMDDFHLRKDNSESLAPDEISNINKLAFQNVKESPRVNKELLPSDLLWGEEIELPAYFHK